MKSVAPPGLVQRACRRGARLLGYELKPIVAGEDACVVRMREIRKRLPGLDGDAREFVEFCLGSLALSNSDNLQDLFVMHETGSKQEGYFAEIGGADGELGSNTLALERHLGWRGIVAEPARCWQAALGRNRGCSIDYRCVSDRTGDTLEFRECFFPANSTIETFAHSDRFAPSRRRFMRYQVPTVSLADLLTQHGAPVEFDYLSLDTEGSELMILQAFDFARHRPKVVTVEHCHSPAREALHALMSRHGYRRKHAGLSYIDDWYVAT